MIQIPPRSTRTATRFPYTTLFRSAAGHGTQGGGMMVWWRDMFGRSYALIKRLPDVRGSYKEKVSLADLTWFRVGGPAEVLFRPADPLDLVHFMMAKPADIPVTVIGVGANLLRSDEHRVGKACVISCRTRWAT